MLYCLVCVEKNVIGWFRWERLYEARPHDEVSHSNFTSRFLIISNHLSLYGRIKISGTFENLIVKNSPQRVFSVSNPGPLTISGCTVDNCGLFFFLFKGDEFPD